RGLPRRDGGPRPARRTGRHLRVDAIAKLGRRVWLGRLVGRGAVGAAGSLAIACRRPPPDAQRPPRWSGRRGDDVFRDGQTQRATVETRSMTLSLADIEAWDEAAIEQVFSAATLRAEGAETTGNTVGDLLTFVNWHGETAEAARESANRIKVTLTDHAEECKRVAAAAQKASAEVADLKYRLSAIKAEASAAQLSVNEQTGAVTSKVTVMTVEMKKQQDLVKADVESRIRQLVADADGVDRDLATAIKTADGAATGPAPTGPKPNLPKPPDNSAKPTDVKKWWDRLTPQQQTDYLANDPAALDRDGIPPEIRDAGNRIRLPHELGVARHTLDQAHDDAIHSTNGTGYANAQALVKAQTRYNDLLAIQSTLYPTNANGTPRAIDPADRRSLVMLDTTSNPNHVLGAIGIGDVEHAAH